MTQSKSSYDDYEDNTNKTECHTQIAGRCSIQKEAEKRIVFDVVEKLNIQSSDNLLDIGCGMGNILIPLSFISKSVVGIFNYKI
jgi:cyclopropane fatty-acyl-phospholipid synthase-like methyltransferase